MKTLATIAILIALVLCVPAHIVGIFWAAIKNGYFSGIERFEDFISRGSK